jgi:translocator protein
MVSIAPTPDLRALARNEEVRPLPCSMIAIAGWCVWRRSTGSAAMKLWWAQLVFNFLWPPTFFAAHRTGFALVVILLLLATILAFIVMSWERERPAAWLFIPYAAWVAFASALNASILVLN